MRYHSLLLITIIALLTGCQSSEEFPYPSLFFGFVFEGFPLTESQLKSKISETKINPEMIVFYLQWQREIQPDKPLVTTLDSIWNVGAVPCITWEPMIIEAGKEITIPFQDIIEGKYDPYIMSIAKTLKNWNKPIVMRFAHEMNLSRYHWGTSLEEYGPRSPEIYILIFRHVFSIFKNLHIKNVLWAFCPNSESLPNAAWNLAKNYYPGDDYVDLLGMDGYNWNINKNLALAKKQTWESPFRSFEQVFEPLYVQLKFIAPKKPIVVFETSTTQRPGAQLKSEWLHHALQTGKNWGLKGIIWFHVKKEEDWRFPTDAVQIPKTDISFQKWILQRIAINREVNEKK